MDDYIEREAFLEEKRKLYCENCKRRYGLKKGKSVVCYEIGDAPCRSCGIGDVLDDVEDFPAADVRPVVRGKWMWELADNGWANHICSVCGYMKNTDIHERMDYSFCPNCGADMRPQPPKED